MPDQTQQPTNLPPATVAPGGSEVLKSDPADEELAKQELARISPSSAKLLELAAKNPPLPKWFDEEEAPPF